MENINSAKVFEPNMTYKEFCLGRVANRSFEEKIVKITVTDNKYLTIHYQNERGGKTFNYKTVYSNIPFLVKIEAEEVS